MGTLGDDQGLQAGFTRRKLLRRGLGAIAGPGLLESGLFAGTDLSEAATPRRGGTLVYASSAEAISLDPPYVGDTVSNAPARMLYNNLVKFTPSLEIQPDLASSWTANGTVWTFKLRRGVMFHDGTAFDAQAVEVHFNRFLGAEKPLRATWWMPFIDHVDALDQNTVRFTTKFPDPAFLVRLANSTGAIESQAAVKKYGKDLARHPVGTGPFQFHEWIQDQHIGLIRNENYWGDKAYLDNVLIRPITDASARVIALTSGDVQLAIGIPPEQVQRVAGDPRLAVATTAVLSTEFLGMNVLKKPFNDVRVRQALNYAIDKAGIVKNLYQGMAEVSNDVVPRGAFGYAPVAGFPYDPAKAKQLLAAAGYPNGFSTTMLVTNGTYPKELELEQTIQQQLAVVGVNIKLDTMEWIRYLELLRMPPTSSPLEMWIDSWAMVEASQIITDRFGCKSFRPHGANTAGFCNEELDRLLAQAQRTLDKSSRDGLLEKAQALVSQQAPAVWLLQLKQAAGMSKKLHNPLLMNTAILTVDEHTWIEA